MGNDVLHHTGPSHTHVKTRRKLNDIWSCLVTQQRYNTASDWGFLKLVEIKASEEMKQCLPQPKMMRGPLQQQSYFEVLIVFLLMWSVTLLLPTGRHLIEFDWLATANWLSSEGKQLCCLGSGELRRLKVRILVNATLSVMGTPTRWWCWGGGAKMSQRVLLSVKLT